jgi:hypothetical protein
MYPIGSTADMNKQKTIEDFAILFLNSNYTLGDF